ncbi:hypothetical protein JKP88DRAFT_251321 [Tribonema minus]|uniref:Uncharacterized protein n=1 Tax=Tribonema minus TaxID=303371 RepID=A0A835ZEU8_9STRA|nr:hypothetical protein JKP88DRAFT_251319 [Tribonema minus]KAG5191743.1 hypothetical protein JKP88DRAFT_251321 [Tribonema minus]
MRQTVPVVIASAAVLALVCLSATVEHGGMHLAEHCYRSTLCARQRATAMHFMSEPQRLDSDTSSCSCDTLMAVAEVSTKPFRRTCKAPSCLLWTSKLHVAVAEKLCRSSARALRSLIVSVSSERSMDRMVASCLFARSRWRRSCTHACNPRQMIANTAAFYIVRRRRLLSVLCLLCFLLNLRKIREGHRMKFTS